MATSSAIFVPGKSPFSAAPALRSYLEHEFQAVARSIKALPQLAFDVRDFDTLQEAFDAAGNARGRVHFPATGPGETVYYGHSISVPESVLVTADPGVIIEKDDSDPNTHVFDCVSTLGSAVALSSDAEVMDETVDVASAATFSVGQLVMVRDATFKFGTDGRNLELNEITGISGTTITLARRLSSSYAVASSAQLVPVTEPARRIVFRDVRCRIPDGGNGGAFYFEEAYACIVENCYSTGQRAQAGVHTWRSGFIYVNGGEFSNGQEKSTPGYGYGLAFAQSSHHCIARGVLTSNVRENAISLGSRFCAFIDCETVGAYDNAYNTHADGNEDCAFINCRSYFSRSKGFYAGGVAAQAPDKRVRFHGCKSFYSGYMAFWADGASGVESEDVTFVDCDAFHFGKTTATSYGFYAFRSIRPRIINCRAFADGEANARALVKVELAIAAIVRGGTFRGATSGWGIIHANCTGVAIDDNDIGDIGANPGVHAESTASTKVYVRRNFVDNATAFTINGGDTHADTVNDWPS